jgi:hypothetical protein
MFLLCRKRKSDAKRGRKRLPLCRACRSERLAQPRRPSLPHTTHTRPVPPVRLPLPPRMSVTPFFLLLLSWLLRIAASSAHPDAADPPRPLAARDSNSHSVPPLGFYDPRDRGGSWLTVRLTRPPSSSVFPPSLLARGRRGGEASQLKRPSLRLESQQYISSRPGRTHQRHHPRNVRRRGPSGSASQRRATELFSVRSVVSLSNLSLCLRTNLTLPSSLIRSMEFAGECLGQHSGGDQLADLGDGHGFRASPPPLPPLSLIFPFK